MDPQANGGTLQGVAALFSGLAYDVGSTYQAINAGAGPARVITASGNAASKTLMPIAIIAGVVLLAYFAFKRG